jgi:uridine phosphorylase
MGGKGIQAAPCPTKTKIRPMADIAESELILNRDGSIYHLRLRPEHVAETVILVGDQGRVRRISQHFDQIEFEGQNREFVTHTGRIGGKRITVLSTGIGTDNIDIVLNELDALVNIDLSTRSIKKDKAALNLIRLGTSGSLQPDIPVDSTIISTHGAGLDGTFQYYAAVKDVVDRPLQEALNAAIGPELGMPHAYVVAGNDRFIDMIGADMYRGITATANGFYGPQGRVLRLATRIDDLNARLASFGHEGHRVTNFEMETSALYALGKALGHRCATVCAIIANRQRKEYSKDHEATVDRLIKTLLDRLV